MHRLIPFVLALALVPAGYAATFTFSQTTGTALTVSTVTLNGDDQTRTFDIVSQVAYTGGQNTAGWKVQASATTPASGANTLPALKLTNATSACASSCTTNPTNSITYPLTMSTLPTTIYNAAANTGKGTFNVTGTFQLTYLANLAAAFPLTYSTTVTLSGSTGP